MLKNRVQYALVFMFVLALFLFYLNFFFFYLLLALLILPVVSFVLSSYISKRLTVSVSTVLQSIGAGNPVGVVFTVDNPTPFPLPALRAEYSAENSFYPNSERQEINLPVRKGKNEYGWSITSIYCGNLKIIGKALTVRDYLGLFTFHPPLGGESICSVFPEPSAIVAEQIEGLFGEGEDETADTSEITEDVTEIKEFREFRPGDRLQRVNWKLSARHGELYVKEFESEYVRTITLLAELRKNSEEAGELDDIISALYSAALTLIDAEQPFAIEWFDSESGKTVKESVVEAEELNTVMCRLFMSPSCEGYPAFEKFTSRPRTANETAIYFTAADFPFAAGRVIGTYKERVALICL